jgi:hypothetical protein
MPLVSSARHGSALRVARRLVVIERHDLLRRSWVRYFDLTFDEVIATENPADAEKLLLSDYRGPTDLLCGQHFGHQWPLASKLVPRWRRICPSLGRVVITSTVDDPVVDCDAADALCRVPIEPGVLREILLGSHE